MQVTYYPEKGTALVEDGGKLFRVGIAEETHEVEGGRSLCGLYFGTRIVYRSQFEDKHPYKMIQNKLRLFQGELEFLNALSIGLDPSVSREFREQIFREVHLESLSPECIEFITNALKNIELTEDPVEAHIAVLSLLPLLLTKIIEVACREQHVALGSRV